MSQPAEPVALGAEEAKPPADQADDGLARVRSAHYDGHDPRHLVSAVVDGQGLVVRVAFAGTIATHSPATVEEAVLAAVGAAQERMNDAWRALATRQEAALEAAMAEDA